MIVAAAGRVAVAALLLAGAAAFDRPVAAAAARLRLPHAAAQPPLAVRLAEAVAVRRAGADRRWIDLLLYCADYGWLRDGGAGLLRLTERATDLDPAFEHVYAFASSMLMWTASRPREAIGVLEKGIRMNPGSVKLRHYLAAFTYYRLDDLRAEVGVLDALARDPEAPMIVRRILANTWEKAGRIDRAVAVLRAIWAATSDPAERRWVEAKMRKYGRSMSEISQ